MKVFLRYYVELPFPRTEIDRIITALPGTLLDTAARDANLRALMMLGPAASRDDANLTPVDLCVSLTVPRLDGQLLRRELQWFVVFGDAVRPVLCGDFELAELGPSRTQLAITAQYRPPVTPDRSLDRMAAQRVGESTLKAFLDGLASCVQASLAPKEIHLVLDPIASNPLGLGLSSSVGH
jgi:hypothetical protein